MFLSQVYTLHYTVANIKIIELTIESIVHRTYYEFCVNIMVFNRYLNVSFLFLSDVSNGREEVSGLEG